MKNPFLDPSFAIRWSELTPDKVIPDLELALERAEKNLATIRALDPSAVTFANGVKAGQEALYELNEAWGRVNHLDSVRNSEELRAAYNAMLPKVTAFYTKIPLDQKLWSALQAFSETEEAKSLEGTDKRLFEEILADFREEGADLPKEKRERLEALSSELAQVTQKFAENVLDATNAWDLVIAEEERLAGLPEVARANARQAAIEKLGEKEGQTRWCFTLHVPSMGPLMQYLDDDSIRREVWEASNRVGRESERDNTDLIRKILGLRSEKAALLGKKDFADMVLSRRMAKNGTRADAFVSDLHDKTADAFQRENEELEAYKAGKTDQEPDLLEPWEVSYWVEKRKKDLFDFDDEELRPYFPIDSVLGGMFELVTRVFGLRMEERSTLFEGEPATTLRCNEADPVDVWHPEVKFYDVFDAEDDRHIPIGRLLGGEAAHQYHHLRHQGPARGIGVDGEHLYLFPSGADKQLPLLAPDEQGAPLPAALGPGRGETVQQAQRLGAGAFLPSDHGVGIAVTQPLPHADSDPLQLVTLHLAILIQPDRGAHGRPLLTYPQAPQLTAQALGQHVIDAGGEIDGGGPAHRLAIHRVALADEAGGIGDVDVHPDLQAIAADSEHVVHLQSLLIVDGKPRLLHLAPDVRQPRPPGMLHHRGRMLLV